MHEKDPTLAFFSTFGGLIWWCLGITPHGA